MYFSEQALGTDGTAGVVGSSYARPKPPLHLSGATRSTQSIRSGGPFRLTYLDPDCRTARPGGGDAGVNVSTPSFRTDSRGVSWEETQSRIGPRGRP